MLAAHFWSLFQESTVVAQEVVVPYETHEFTFAEIVAATDYFGPHTVIKSARSGQLTVYKGTLHDGREVVVKRIMGRQLDYLAERFRMELEILPRLRHKHIVRLLGSCVTASKDKRLLTTPQKKKKTLLSWWRKEPEAQEEPEQPEWLIVYEYMENSTLFHHLHPDDGSSELSPVTVSWKMRMEVLLGVLGC
ncbi:hypothetical protein ACQJBY_030062 [Aegilops geniculata]